MISDTLEDDNVTHRLKKRIPSLPDLSESFITTGENSFGTKSQSLPDINAEESLLVQELKEEIRKLQMELQTAICEIENLNMANGQLNKKVQSQDKIITLYKTIGVDSITKNCESSMSTPTRIYKRSTKSSHKKKPITPEYFQSTEITTPSSEQNIILKTMPTIMTSSVTRPTDELTTSNDNQGAPGDGATTNNTSMTEKYLNNKHKILILGDELVLGLAGKLDKSRHNSWNDHYKPFAYVKPNASSSEILNDYIKIKHQVSDNDYVILGTGSHDKNPNMLIKRICIALHELSGTNVILLPINKNRYLNEKKK